MQIYYSIQKHHLSIEIKDLMFKMSKLVIFELTKIIEYLSKYLSSRPLLRPGQGEKKLISLGSETRLIPEGTLKWWDYAISSVVERILEKKKNNFISNTKLQCYLFFLYYKYSFGATKFIN